MTLHDNNLFEISNYIAAICFYQKAATCEFYGKLEGSFHIFASFEHHIGHFHVLNKVFHHVAQIIMRLTVLVR